MRLRALSASRRAVCGRRGNAMLQTTASIGVLAILAATTGPMVERYINHAKTLKARSEVKAIASVFNLLINDLGHEGLPAGPDSDTWLELLVSDGDVPVLPESEMQNWALPSADGKAGLLNDFLIANTPGFAVRRGGSLAFGWDGPYLQTPLGADPWGNRYAANIGVLALGREYVPIIVSAGADGVLDTPYFLEWNDLGDRLGDDIYQVLR